jgi:hypothetical protein
LNLFYTSKINISTKSKQHFYFGLIASITIAFGLFLNAVQPGMILTDGGIFSSIAFKMINHGILYIDAWENKPPGIFYLMIIFFSLIPSKVYAIYVMSGFFFLATSYLIYNIVYGVFQSLFKSVLFSAIALIFTIYPNNIGDGLYTEIYGTFFILLSIHLWDIFKNKRDNKYAILSALSLGFSFWFKEPFIIICIPIMLYYLWDLKDRKIIYNILISFVLPSIILISILLLTGSLIGFIDMIVYNFTYLGSDEAVPMNVKLSDLYKNFIDNLKIIFIVYFLLLISKSEDPKIRWNKLFWLIILISSSVFFLMSPYNFGHYYYTFFTLFFIVFIKTYQISIIQMPFIKLITIPIFLWTIFQLNQTHGLNLSFQLKPYQEDVISRRLKATSGKSLFVDCVEEGGYYIKGNILYNTFVPVGLPVHFSNQKKGVENRKKLWNELYTNPPDYIIRFQNTSYYYWHLPHNGFYEKEYKVIDSSINNYQQKIYLLQYIYK